METKKIYFCYLDYSATCEGHTVDLGLVVETSELAARKLMSATSNPGLPADCNLPEAWYECLETSVTNEAKITRILEAYFSQKHVNEMIVKYHYNKDSKDHYLYWGHNTGPITWRYHYHINRS